ncbi:unnamed protein product [Clonostachys rosea]|uniref:Glycoside hydrolase family 71 protein n=1 Tax=Bionectria ochroleuca TaxID=29856 RepID=A0ABY6V036_BIOOC|nr:unnamed protein product [Clonostachys rosea]
MRLHIAISALAALIPTALAGDVFAHYMAQTLNGDHASQDVQAALALGIDAFVLNVGMPNADWCISTVEQLFAAASGTNFKIFFSLDLYAESDPYAFTTMINKYFSHPNYYKAGPSSAPMLSTFQPGAWGSDNWGAFLASLSSKPYFVPDFDQAEGYYENPEAFWYYWKDTLDGSFSWEQSWPGVTDTQTNVTSEVDAKVLSATHAQGKVYMMGLSSLQYKHYKEDHWFRSGDVVLPERMAQILALSTKPDYVQIQTWNDAGESHYIGSVWSEGLLEETLKYANQEEHPHQGWQPLVASFITAFKNGADASGMRPPAGSNVVGSMWHHEFLLASESCAGDSLGTPRGYGAAKDRVNWAVVVGEGVSGYSVQVWSGGKLIAKDALNAGLNYKSVPGVNVGEQVVQVVDASGNVIIEGGKSTKGVSQGLPSSGICNLNFQVAQLA